MALDQSALLDLLGELKLTDVTDRIRVATSTGLYRGCRPAPCLLEPELGVPGRLPSTLAPSHRSILLCGEGIRSVT